MNETQFKEKWESEMSFYHAWGKSVVKTILHSLEGHGKNIGTFLKIPLECRIKDTKSLIDKAFYRPGKVYSDPYNQIEDKVGARLVVLLLDDVNEICKLIEGIECWSFDACKHFDEDKEKNPLLFTYQSVHYILRSKEEIVHSGITIPAFTPCEVQIRTLLQHAHAELTHDAIYKAKRTVQPNVHRTVAKSMALIETTDDFFSQVTHELNHGPLQEYGIIEKLDGLYYSTIGIKPYTPKSSIIIWDEFEQFIDEKLFDNIQVMLNNNDFLYGIIRNKYSLNAFYQQSTVFFVYWLLKKRKNRLLADWPFSRKVLELLAVDIGVTTWSD